ncbi:TonB-dependent receptor [Olivibacter sp. CPCC 100613]|uniref:TonB-dependent receptor n=1 Tax=Olivibacter sp. CPCC 100613 TaxID=3079931 RepID=UPI002FFC5C3C
MQIIDLFREIKKQTGYSVICNAEIIRTTSHLNVDIHNKPLFEALDMILSPHQLMYTVRGQSIVVRKQAENEKKGNAVTIHTEPQQRITGMVTGPDGSPLAGVTIKLKGKSIGEVTDSHGTYGIEASNGQMLQFSYLGYESMEILVGNDLTINVKLQPINEALTEVVVVGYGTQKKAVVSGAIASVKGEDLAKSPSVNLSNSFAGRLPGVTAMQSSGEPGYDGSTLRIRGINSLPGGNSSPLIVIDGVPQRAGGLDRINPNDIESVSVLKDASAAIYGSRAGNGVILVTTKQGKMGKTQISYDFTYGIQRPTRTPKMVNSEQYTSIINEVTGVYPQDPAKWSEIWQAFNTGTGAYNLPSGTINPEYSPEERQKYSDGSDPLRYPNTDWFAAAIKDWSPQQRHNVQINGGTETTKYLISLGYLNQDAIYKNSATFYKQYDLRANLEFNFGKYVTARLGITGREEARNFPTRGAGDIFRFLVRGLPINIATWPNGLPGPDLENGANPVVITTGATGYDRNTRDYLQNTGSIDIKIPGVDGLKLTGTASIDKYWGRSKRWETPWTLYDWDQVSFEADGVTPKLSGYIPKGIEPKAQLREATEDQLAINVSALLSYDKAIKGGHNISAIAGLTRETVTNNGFYAARMDFPSILVEQLNFGDRVRQTLGNENTYDRARLSYYGRINYNYQEKYLLEFNWRVDGSYIFPPNKRFGFFPGVSAGWRVSEEGFFKNKVAFVNDLKLRGSWGQMGAEAYYDGSLQEYKYLSLMNTGQGVFSDLLYQTIYESTIPNPNFTWEVANNSNVGLDASFLNHKLALELDLFYNKRTSVLTKNPGVVPISTGISGNLPIANLGNLINKGYEIKLTYTDKVGDLFYNIGVNGGYAKNNVQYSSDVANTLPYQKQIGKVTDSWLVYLYDGVFKDQAAIDANTIDYTALGLKNGTLLPGDMKYVDYNGDGKITSDDRVRLDHNGTPTFTGGLILGGQYKGFDFNVLIQGATGGMRRIGPTESGLIGNYLEWNYDHRWTIDNPSDTDPRLTNRSDTYYTTTDNTYWIRSTNYIRLKNIELGYTLPTELVNRIGLSTLRFYTNGINLLTIDKIKIWDPEADNSTGQFYPQSKIISFGIKAVFN